MSDEAGKRSVNVVRLHLIKVPKERAEVWREIAESIQRLKNSAMVHWRRWHEDQKSGLAMYQWMRDLRAWQRKKQELEAVGTTTKDMSPKAKREAREAKRRDMKGLGGKPTCPVVCYPKAMDGDVSIYRRLAAEFPELPTTMVSMAFQVLMKDWKQHTSGKTAFKMWQRAVAGFGELPSYSSPQPIPLHQVHVRVIPPGTVDDDWRAGLVIERTEGPNGKGKNVEDVVIVQTKGKKCAGLRRVLERCADGEYKICGSHVLFKGGKWYLHLVHKQPAETPPKLDPARVAALEPGIRSPWSLWLPGATRDLWPIGRGRELIFHRRRLNWNRSIQNEAYRDGGVGKGHGRKRFFERMRNRLAGFKKTFSDRSVVRIIEECVKHGCGTLVYRKPADRHTSKTFLATAGALPQRPDSWPWFLFEGQLRRKCEQAGLVLKVEDWQPPEDCEGSGDAENPGTSRSAASGNGNGSSVNGNGAKATKSGRKRDQKRESSQSGPQNRMQQGARGAPVAKGE